MRIVPKNETNCQSDEYCKRFSIFDLQPYKNPGHKERYEPYLSFEALCTCYPEERSLPYFSISIEQLEENKSYMHMNGIGKGDFLRLLPILWRANGLLQDYSKAIAKKLGFTEDGWKEKRQMYLDNGLLDISPDGVYILNIGLRQQYLNTLKAANAKRRK